MTQPMPKKPAGIKLRTKSKTLELEYDASERYSLSWEYLRVYSPSAEVKGHGPNQEVLQTGKIDINISAVKPVGNYALQLVFDDGHDTGLYSWSYLYDMCVHQSGWWQEYLDRLQKAGESRDPSVQVIKLGL